MAKIKLAELSASVKGSNVKSKTAEEKNSKMPVNLGPSSTVVDPKGMVSSELLFLHMLTLSRIYRRKFLLWTPKEL